ncbi:MAG TPA: aldo/keto reductase [Beijerinckiaceae bacterium]|nr:aldo/keto reductase [Beijerinckiaceae bacterium]
MSSYVRLGNSGLKVSRLWLGTMMFGLRTQQDEAARIVDAAREAGLNALDTADTYANGASETMLGGLIRKDRSRWVLATKVFNRMGAEPNMAGLSRRWILEECDHSLRRLGTDWIDLYYLHKDDYDTPLEETVAAIGDLIRAGKIRYFGLSNFRAWRMARVAELCDRMGVPRPIAVQPPYSAVTRGIEVEVLPCAAAYGMGPVVYSPLARGVLTGKYRAGEAPEPETRAARKDERLMQTEFRPESFAIAETLRAHAEATGRTAVDFAIGWVLANRLVNGVIAGPRTLAQWQAYMHAASSPFSAEDEALVDSLVHPGHASTHFYTDPQYPVTGRQN